MALAKAYAVSKYMLLLFTVELAERVQNRGVAVNAIKATPARYRILSFIQFRSPVLIGKFPQPSSSRTVS
jgi:NAD(P)-dependent dehydrogenase (short-subunit alcohol dehydrogenase family)